MKDDFRIVLEIDDKKNITYDDDVVEKSHFLRKFDGFDRICIQCHDNPDADALASGHGLYQYFLDKYRSSMCRSCRRVKFL